MADEKAAKSEKPVSVTLKNNGIRHRLMHAEHGNHTWEAGEARAVPAGLAHILAVDHDDFEPVKAEGVGLDEFKAGVKAAKDARKEKEARIAETRAREAEEARLADEKTARERNG